MRLVTRLPSKTLPNRRHWSAWLLSTVLVTPAAWAQVASEAVPAEKPAAQQNAAAQSPPPTVDLFTKVTNAAGQLAEKPYQKVETRIPESLQNMDYSQYRAIRYHPDSAIWKDESLFELQLFHLGFLYREPVSIGLVEAGSRQHLPFKPELFSYEGPAASFADMAPVDMGYAGFRVHYPLNNSEYKDEVMVFQGASYFRLVGPGQAYGLSARGLAIDTAESSGEEFPVFRKFWLEKPDPESNRLVIYALLDSPSVTGAYRFQLVPGAPTRVQVESRLFARKDIKKLGVAPLTSMFHHGENHTRFVDDFRPEVHDSDGLMMQTHNGEWIWRPLSNPASLKVTSLQDTTPGGFGLMQRDRDFQHYLDAEADYERRPSFWITPQNDWGKGRVELVEIPTDSETNDNIVAYWVPEKSVKAGDSLAFDYQLVALDQMPVDGLAKVARTRIGWGALPGEINPPPHSTRQFAVDFVGENLSSFAAAQAIKAELKLSSGTLSDLTVFKLPDNHWRVAFKIAPQGQQPVDMRLSLQLHQQTLSEVWSYVWHPDSIQ